MLSREERGKQSRFWIMVATKTADRSVHDVVRMAAEIRILRADSVKNGEDGDLSDGTEAFAGEVLEEARSFQRNHEEWRNPVANDKFGQQVLELTL